jgi:hypothetical protein
MQNLNEEERARWKETCRIQRDIARRHPAYDPRMLSLADYHCQLGPWHLVLTHDTFLTPSQWHGSVSFMKDIGDETVYGKDGQPIFEVPQQGMLAVTSWAREEYDTARDLLGQLFGPLIHHQDQRVIESHGKDAMVLNWFTAAKDADQRIELVRI